MGTSQITGLRKGLELHNAAQERAAVTHTGPQHMKGVSFPLDRNAEQAVRDLANRQKNFVQLSVSVSSLLFHSFLFRWIH